MNAIIKSYEKEVLVELINICLAKAADAFAIIVNEKVLMSTPNLEVVELEKIIDTVPHYHPHTLIIESLIDGDLKGKTFLLFSESQADRLAEICLGNITTKDNSNYQDLQKSLLLEIGNIITGSIVTQFSNLLNINLFGAVPDLKNTTIAEVFKEMNTEYIKYKPIIFTVKTQIVYTGKSFELPFLILFDMDALRKMVTIINDFNSNKGLLLKSN